MVYGDTQGHTLQDLIKGLHFYLEEENIEMKISSCSVLELGWGWGKKFSFVVVLGQSVGGQCLSSQNSGARGASVQK